MTTKDIPQVYALLKAYLACFAVAPQLSQEEVGHKFVPKDGINYTYVVENPETKEITDFVSFYRLSFQILNKDPSHTHTHINSAYLLYNVTTKNDPSSLLKYALFQAKENNMDVFNSLDIMNNEEFLQELKFMPGDGYLHYYLYNWSLKQRLTPQ